MKRLTTGQWKRLSLGASIVAALVLGLTFFRYSASAASEPSPLAPKPSIHEQFDGWEYLAAPDSDNLNITVNYEKLTAAGIRAFGEANRKLVEQVHGQVVVSVVFRRPLSVDEFKDLVRKSGLKVENYTMRAVDGTGGRITIQGTPNAGDLVPQEMFNTMLANVQSRSQGATFKGIVTVDATATQAQLKQLLADERVFTTDVSQARATERARAALAAHNPAQAQLPAHTRLAAPLYWFMENTGVAEK